MTCNVAISDNDLLSKITSSINAIGWLRFQLDCRNRHRRHLFRLSLRALAGEKDSFFAAATVIVAPVDGLRPSRSGVSLTLNFPKPGIEVSVPDTAEAVMAAKTASTIAFPCAFVRLCSTAILSAISLVVVMVFSSNGKKEQAFYRTVGFVIFRVEEVRGQQEISTISNSSVDDVPSAAGVTRARATKELQATCMRANWTV